MDRGLSYLPSNKISLITVILELKNMPTSQKYVKSLPLDTYSD